MNPLVFAMKCLLSSLPSSSLLQISRHLLFVSPVNWLVLNVPKVNRPMKAHQDQEGALSRDAYEADDFVSADKYVVNTPGCLLSGYGREAPHNQFHGSTLLVLSGLRNKSLLQLAKS